MNDVTLAGEPPGGRGFQLPDLGLGLAGRKLAVEIGAQASSPPSDPLLPSLLADEVLDESVPRRPEALSDVETPARVIRAPSELHDVDLV